MPATPTEVSRDLQDLLKYQRRDVANLNQRQAGLAAGGMSEIYWRKIESGERSPVPADTIARMAYAIGVTPAQLRNIGHGHVADLVERRIAILGPESQQEDMVTYLMHTPGLTDEQRAVLVTVAKGLADKQDSYDKRRAGAPGSFTESFDLTWRR